MISVPPGLQRLAMERSADATQPAPGSWRLPLQRFERVRFELSVLGSHFARRPAAQLTAAQAQLQLAGVQSC